jgi:hypothetical protein
VCVCVCVCVTREFTTVCISKQKKPDSHAL